MKYLLDTHIFLWRLLAPERLSETQALAMDSQENQLLLSPISIWETLVLARKGKLELALDPEDFVRQALKESPVRMAPFNFEIVIRSEALEGFSNPDPADRFLIATSLVEEACLITSDKKMQGYGPVPTLA